jgi:integrase
VASVKKSFAAARGEAGIEDFIFHDLRHPATTDWRLQGHDYIRIMAAAGHKTMTTFRRYNTVPQEELKTLGKGEANYTWSDTKGKGE